MDSDVERFIVDPRERGTKECAVGRLGHQSAALRAHFGRCGSRNLACANAVLTLIPTTPRVASAAGARNPTVGACRSSRAIVAQRFDSLRIPQYDLAATRPAVPKKPDGEYWLGTEDSNPDLLIQSQLSYH